MNEKHAFTVIELLVVRRLQPGSSNKPGSNPFPAENAL